MKKLYDLSLIERNNVAENTIELIFTKPSDYDFKIGQYTFLDVANKGENKIVRALSIASHPDEDTLRFVMRISDSDFKTRCLEMKKGDNATITQATGNFCFKFSDKEIVFLISGIGIASIMPMLMELEKINYQGKVSLFYSNRTLAKTTYHERLQNFNIKNYNYYIIGTSDFIKTMKTLLEENHIDKKNYLVDNFG